MVKLSQLNLGMHRCLVTDAVTRAIQSLLGLIVVARMTLPLHGRKRPPASMNSIVIDRCLPIVSAADEQSGLSNFVASSATPPSLQTARIYTVRS
jgi:hypothetical protein